MEYGIRVRSRRDSMRRVRERSESSVRQPGIFLTHLVCSTLFLLELKFTVNAFMDRDRGVQSAVNTGALHHSHESSLLSVNHETWAGVLSFHEVHYSGCSTACRTGRRNVLFKGCLNVYSGVSMNQPGLHYMAIRAWIPATKLLKIVTGR